MAPARDRREITADLEESHDAVSGRLEIESPVGAGTTHRG